MSTPSPFIRDVLRYHYWPSEREYWHRAHARSHGAASPGLPQGAGRGRDRHYHGVSGDYVGYDNRVSPQNFYKVRYHHWPESRNTTKRKGLVSLILVTLLPFKDEKLEAFYYKINTILFVFIRELMIF